MDSLRDAAFEVTADRLAWLNDDEANDLADYPGDGWQQDGPGPTLEDEAEERGYQTGLNDGRPQSPTAWPDSARMAYARGRQRAVKERIEAEERERIDYEAWLEELARERDAELMLEDGRGWADAERVEAAGVIEARKG
jgi:hypothetical protein